MQSCNLVVQMRKQSRVTGGQSLRDSLVHLWRMSWRRTVSSCCQVARDVSLGYRQMFDVRLVRLQEV